jgi:hypothetical protein
MACLVLLYGYGVKLLAVLFSNNQVTHRVQHFSK